VDPVVKPLTCPSCGKVTSVRVMPGAQEHRYHCPHCKKITTARG
jgi:predicted RNA-binding Zn-ribbon protein involved in translation (DUF1610 family)